MPLVNGPIPSSIRNDGQSSRRHSIISEIKFTDSVCDLNSSSICSPARNSVNNNENTYFKLVSNWLKTAKANEERARNGSDKDDDKNGSNDSNNSMSIEAEDVGLEEGHEDYEERGGVIAQ